MLNIESIRQHLSVSNFTDLTNPSSLIALGLSLSLGYAAVKYLTKGPQLQPTNMAPAGPQTIVIVGGGYAGTGLAHRLLSNLAPKVPGLKVIFISKTTHLFWNFAAVRGIIPGEIADEQLFLPLAPGFAKYPDTQFEFIVGSATVLDVAGNAVEVQTANGPRRVNYDHLVLTTGSKLAAEHLPFKSLNSHEETISAWHQLQQEVDQAESIVIAGAGSTGVETAGELGSKYGDSKKITLVVDGALPLPTLLPSAGKFAENALRNMGVEIVLNARVNGVEDTAEGGKRLTLSNGTSLTADLYLPLYGVRPNSEFVPPHLLDDNGNIKMQPTLRVRGLNNVWAAGDVSDVEAKQAIKAGAQAKHVYSNLEAVLTGNEAGVTGYKPSAMPLIFVTMGKKKGTGQMGGFKPFSMMVSYIKGRTLFVEKAPAVAAGKIL